MKIIYNRVLPFPGFKAINFFGVLFVRKEYRGRLNPVNLRHEMIHSAQMRELLWILFYGWYFLEWTVRLFLPGNAYRNISFEQEAYEKQGNEEYLKRRKHFSFLRYLRKK